MELKSKKLKTRNLPEREYHIDVITSKPYGFIVFFLIVGLYLLWQKSYIFGTIILALFLYYLVVNKNQKVTEFYEDFVVFFNDKDASECYIVFWDEIKSWSYERGRFDTDYIHIQLKDNHRIQFLSLSRSKMRKYFQQKVGKLEERKSTQKVKAK